METVTHNGRETVYRVAGEAGDGPKILYIHGSGGTHQSWIYQYGNAGPVHPAVALDLSGHGDSTDIEAEPGEETLTAYVQDVSAVAAETDPDVIVGHSLGGAILLQGLLDGALDPEAVVLAGTGARLPVHEQIQTMLADDFEALVSFAHSGPFLYHDASETVRSQSKATLLETGQTVTRRDFLTCDEFDVSDRLGEIETPALAIVGTEDQMTPLAYHSQLESALPDCTLHTVENAAHMLMLEQPEQFNAAIGEFVANSVTQ